jgi:hypothetical protein
VDNVAPKESVSNWNLFQIANRADFWHTMSTQMKTFLILVSATLWLVAATVQAAPWEPGLVARIHFAGGDAVTADPNSIPLKNVWSSPEAQVLRMQTLDKLAQFLDGWLRQAIAPSLPITLQTRPLLADLVQAEWQLEVRQPAGSAVEFSLAVRLANDRALAWQAVLNPVLSGWKQSSPSHHGYLMVKEGWLFFALDNAPAPVAAGAIANLNHAWLTAEVDWTRLAVWFPAVRKFDIPQTRLQVTGINGNFEATGHLYLTQPLPPLQKWQFPTNLVHSPFLSFTAARGISDWLRQQPWAVGLGLNPLPDQLFTWVEPQIPFLAFAAIPMPNGKAVLPKVAGFVNDGLRTDPVNSPFFGVAVQTNTDNIIVTGMPLVDPFLQARQEPGGDFLFGGYIPQTPRGQVAPPELFARLSQPDLVFFHWEITSDRMKIFPQLYQLTFLFTMHRQLEGGTAANNWLKQLCPTLGPTVTTATEVSPTELAFARRAPAGLTAVELVALGSWLEAPNFPGCDLSMKMVRKKLPHPPTPSTPAPNAQHP